jgi:hypothetical protein
VGHFDENEHGTDAIARERLAISAVAVKSPANRKSRNLFVAVFVEELVVDVCPEFVYQAAG